MTVLDAAVLDILSRPLFARLSTNGRDGYPHTVPIWFDTDADATGATTIWFISDRAVTKTRNALADQRATVVIGGDRVDGDGYMFRGILKVEDDPQQVMTHRMIDRYEVGDRNSALREEWKDADIVVLRFHIERVTKVFG